MLTKARSLCIKVSHIVLSYNSTKRTIPQNKANLILLFYILDREEKVNLILPTRRISTASGRDNAIKKVKLNVKR